jgi:ribonuclease T2
MEHDLIGKPASTFPDHALSILQRPQDAVPQPNRIARVRIRRIIAERVRVAMVKLIAGAAFLACLIAPLAAAGQDSRQNVAGQFDFYVLALSWSPSFCAEAAERNAGRLAGPQCGARPYSFVVHGLWPQYEEGFPQYCQLPAPRLYRGNVSSMLDLMPAPQLIFNEWDRHGTCSGLAPRVYFAMLRKARAAVKIPPDYIDLKQPLTVTPGAVADAFVKANPGLSPGAIAVGCDHKRLTEVRLCLSKDLSMDVQFHDCAEIAKRTCRRDQLIMPPARGGNS